VLSKLHTRHFDCPTDRRDDHEHRPAVDDKVREELLGQFLVIVCCAVASDDAGVEEVLAGLQGNELALGGLEHLERCSDQVGRELDVGFRCDGGGSHGVSYREILVVGPRRQFKWLIVWH
jgi:hypothetical protein